MNLIRKPGVVFEIVADVPDLRCHLRGKFSVITLFDFRQSRSVCANEFAEFPQKVSTLGWGEPRPLSFVEGTISGIDGTIDIIRVATGN